MNAQEGILIGGMALVTFTIRSVVLAMSGRLKLPARLLQALNYVPPAVLTAIIVPAVVVENGDVWLSWQNPRLWGAIAAIVIGFWHQNLLLTIVISMGVFLLCQISLT
ncbi:MAG: AzlD domain-containing protein [Leptolyngbyaceae cyanobacterium]